MSEQARQSRRGAALRLLSVVIPARNEHGSVGPTVGRLHAALQREGIPHEIVVVDDGSTDRTGEVLQELRLRIPEVVPIRHEGEHGFGRAVLFGFDRARGDALVVMMADESDECRDVVRYWRELEQGADCVFGSRFIPGGGAHGYPVPKLLLNRVANTLLRGAFGIQFNDITNAFKAYRREVIDGCRPLTSRHFELCIELPLKAIVRGFSWKVVPITWRNRSAGVAKFRIREMGSRYLSTCLRVWLEKNAPPRTGSRGARSAGVTIERHCRIHDRDHG